MKLRDRIKLAWQVFKQRGILVQFNHGEKVAYLRLFQLPTEGDTITIGHLTARFEEPKFAYTINRDSEAEPCRS